MSLMFLARFTRADILMPVTYLATKSSDPKQKDYNKAVRILNYVVNTMTRCLWFRSRTDLKLQVFTDASHMLHLDTKGHGGIIVTYGGTETYQVMIMHHSLLKPEILVLIK
jgi:hypothetical protein